MVDAWAVAEALTRKDTVGAALAQRVTESTCPAPHLIDAEVGHVLRRVERLGQITEESATTGLRALPSLVDERYARTGWLAAEAWRLRHTLTFHDGLYVALAARLDLPLPTGDAKLGKAPDPPCQVTLIN